MAGPFLCPACRELRRRPWAYLCGPCWIRLPRNAGGTLDSRWSGRAALRRPPEGAEGRAAAGGDRAM